jgi:hypothetical protein
MMAQAGSDKVAPNRHFMKACRYLTETTEAKDHGDASHGTIATYRPVKQPPTGGSEGRPGIYRGYADHGDMITL